MDPTDQDRIDALVEDLRRLEGDYERAMVTIEAMKERLFEKEIEVVNLRAERIGQQRGQKGTP